jgi:hypothetical protein
MFASVQQYFLAGWGSLFLGIPGFEHLVPPPKELPSSNVSRASSSRGAPAGARSLVAAQSSSSPASPPEGGLRGFFRQLREMGAAASLQAEESSKARSAAKTSGNTVVDADEAYSARNGRPENANGARDSVGSGNGNSAANRRLRASAKATPMLVKPPSRGELPEQAIQREATDPAPTLSGPLPEVEVMSAANAASSDNGKNGAKGNAGNAGAAARTGTPRSAATGKGTTGSIRVAGVKGNQNGANSQRKSTGGTSGRGSTAGNGGARNRSGNNRAKGGK